MAEYYFPPLAGGALLSVLVPGDLASRGAGNGRVAYDQATRALWFFVPDASGTPDGVTRVQGIGGQWVRGSGNPRAWAGISSWEINGTTGSDLASGAPGDPLASFAEWMRRTEGHVSGTVTIAVTGSFSGGVQGTVRGASASSRLQILGTPIASSALTVTSSSASVPGSNTATEVEASGLAGLLNRRLRHSDGRAAFGVKVNSGDAIRTTQWAQRSDPTSAALPTETDPPDDELFVDTMPVVTGAVNLDLIGQSGTTLVLMSGLDLADTSLFNVGSSQFSPWATISESIVRALRLEASGALVFTNVLATGLNQIATDDLLWVCGGIVGGSGDGLQTFGRLRLGRGFLSQGRRIYAGGTAFVTSVATAGSGMAFFDCTAGCLEISGNAALSLGQGAPFWGDGNSGNGAAVRVWNVARYSNLAALTLAHSAAQVIVGTLAATDFSSLPLADTGSGGTMAFFAPGAQA
jgi:hypothetical protein